MLRRRTQENPAFLQLFLLVLGSGRSLWWRLLCLGGLWFVADVPATCECGELRPIQGLPSENFTIPGDLTIAVVMSLHRYDPDKLCGNVIRELGALQRLEAMVFAVEEINNRSDILSNATLGLTVLDDCFNQLTALGRSLQFIQDENGVHTNGAQSVPAVSAVAVIGAEGSPRTLEMADVLSLFQVPQLSYASSSALLDSEKFSYFSRIVPSDKMQAKAIVDVLLAYRWKYVSVLYTEGSYGTEGFRAVERNLELNEYCLAVTQMIRKSFQEKDYTDTIRKLLTKPQARVVVLFTSQSQAIQLFKAVDKMGLESNFTWVGGDSIGMNPHIFSDQGLEHVVDGVISVNFISAPVDRFEQRFRHMTYKTGSRNPWFGEFIASIFNCSMDGTSSSPLEPCDEDREIMTSDQYKPESTASLSMNAVYALAHALDAVLKNCSLDDVRKCVKPWVLRDTLRTVGFQGEGTYVSFDREGNGQTNYEIRNIKYLDGTLVQEQIGLWDTASSEFFYFDRTSVQWSHGFLTGHSRTDDHGFVIPVSVCSPPCQPGHQAVVTSPSCCFYCEACRDNERTVPTPDGKLPKCEPCPTATNFTWPDDETRTECVPLDAVYINIAQPAGCLLFTFDVCVFVMTIATAFFYVKNGQSRLIKASSKHLCMMMLAGHLMTCIIVSAFVVKPSDVSCIIVNGGFHLSFTLSYAPLVVKTSRIYRIFVAGTKSAKKPRFVSTRFQVSIAAAVIILQILVTSIALILRPPRALTLMHNLNERHLSRECTVPTESFLASIVYNILLMTQCAFLAIKTRSLPSNFNEAKFISFSIYTTVLLWLSFLPSFFTAKNYTVQALCLAVALLFNVMSFQVFLFLPKLYALYFVSETDMNLRDNSRNRSRVTPSLPGQNSRSEAQGSGADTDAHASKNTTVNNLSSAR